MKTIYSLMLVILLSTLAVGCGQLPGGAPDATPPISTASPTSMPETDTETEQTTMEKSLHLMINGTAVQVDWEDNTAVDALTERVFSEPLSVAMSMYGGFEQVGSLGTSLPRDDSQTTTQAGDIVLYAGNQIVIFYGSNSWAYTRLGRITDQSVEELRKLLGNGDVTITLSME